MTAFIDIDYNDKFVYNKLSVRIENQSFFFNSKDFVKDWFNLMKFIYTNNRFENIVSIGHSSDVDSFIMNSNFVSLFWKFENSDSSPILTQEYQDNFSEFFVTKEQKDFTWKMLRDYCEEK